MVDHNCSKISIFSGFPNRKKRNFEVKISAHPQAKCLWISGGVGGKGDKPK